MMYLIAALFIAFLDQCVKYAVKMSLPLGGTRPLIPGVVQLTHIHNDGAAFSMLAGMRWPLIVVTGVVLAALIYVVCKRKVRSPLGLTAVAMVCGGAVGNLIDRVRFGYVVDMFDLQFMNFAVFNVADMFIVVGGILIAVYILFFFEESSGGKAARRRGEGEQAGTSSAADGDGAEGALGEDPSDAPAAGDNSDEADR